jgi:2-polyprenyl-6-methoxyphenol hydroxylase-like FAD-dependent oxidoreductase
MTSVLISGASIAGLTLATWLRRYDFTVTVVERNPGLRAGGQAIDVRGPALGVLDRMGILNAARARETAIRGMSVVDSSSPATRDASTTAAVTTPTKRTCVPTCSGSRRWRSTP